MFVFFPQVPFITIEAPPWEATVSEALGHSLCEDQCREGTLFGGVPWKKNALETGV